MPRQVMGRASMHCILLHIPKFSSVYLPLGEFMNITYMPMGLPALANRLTEFGYPTDIVHFGVEWIVDREHALLPELAQTDAQMVGADLYWHYQTYDVLDVLKRLKQARPDLFVFLGGTTASYFGDKLLAAYPFVDAVVRGDGEIAVVELAEARSGKRRMDEVANLIWRDPDGHIVTNARVAVSDQGMLDSLDFGSLDRVRNVQVYVDNFGFPLAYPKQFSRQRNAATQRMAARSFFPLFVGRGCAWECSFCGGNRKTLREIMQTARLRFRDVRRVVDDVERAMEHGYKTMALCFDPTPQKDDYYVAMFEEIRRRRLAVDFYFECWGLPTPRFLAEWQKTFGVGNPHSYLALSPDAGNEAVRKLNKQPYYSNAEFFDTMDRMQAMGISADIFFTIALPGETIKTVQDTRQMADYIRSTYSVHKRVMTWSVQLEPGSPQFEYPERFNMTTNRRTVQDYFRVHGSGGSDTYTTLGYKINDFFGDARDQGSIEEFEAHIQSLKCMDFCFMGEEPSRASDPANGRAWCLERRQELAAQAGIAGQLGILSDTHRYAQAHEQIRAAFPAQRPRWK